MVSTQMKKETKSVSFGDIAYAILVLFLCAAQILAGIGARSNPGDGLGTAGVLFLCIIGLSFGLVGLVSGILRKHNFTAIVSGVLVLFTIVGYFISAS